MIRIQHSVQVSCPTNEVFEYLTTVENLSNWQANVVRARRIDDGPLRGGVKFEQTIKLGGRQLPSVCTVTDFHANDRFAFSMQSAGPIDCDAHFDLQPLLSGTRLTLSGVARLKGFWRLLQPLAAMELKRETEKEIQEIKRLLEAEVPMPVR